MEDDGGDTGPPSDHGTDPGIIITIAITITIINRVKENGAILTFVNN